MKIKRIAALILAFITLITTVAACSDASEGGTAQTEAGTEQVTEAEVETEIPDNLPEVKYDNANFNLLVRTSRLDQYYCEEMTGDVVDDAVVGRNSTVEERFAVKLTFIDLGDDGTLFKKTISSSVMAGDGAYDIVAPDYWWGIETGGYFIDLLSLDYLDFTKPWWWEGWNQNVLIYGKLYNAVGDFSLDRIKNTELIFFNKTVAENYNINDLYDLVRSGKWTVDKMIEYCAAVGGDLDGDGKITGTDRFGAAAALHAGRGLMYSIGMKVIYSDDNNEYHLGFTEDRFVDIYNKTYEFFCQTPSINYSDSNDHLGMFTEDRLLFWMGHMGVTEYLRNMDADFGIIPVPMYDESQSGYISSNLGTPYFSIVTTARDIDMSAIILEALNAESYKQVRPVYYDIAVKGKYSRDTDSEEILDVIMDGCYIDFAFVNTAFLSGIAEAIFTKIVEGAADISSFVASKEASTQRALDKMLETYSTNYGI